MTASSVIRALRVRADGSPPMNLADDPLADEPRLMSAI
jgi:hypothetical protein